MPSSPSRAVFGGVVVTAAAAVTAAVTIGGSPAGAAASCTARAVVPKTLTTHATRAATLHMTLRGTSGCQAATFDNGASAYLVSPSGRERISLLWHRFGTTETQDLYSNLDESGTWHVVGGTTQTYDADYVRIPSHWQTTSVRVRAAKSR